MGALWFSSTGISRSSSRAAMVLLAAAGTIPLRADVCVWRDPERSMTQIFPAAKSYQSLERKLSAEQRARIEQRLGQALDPSERDVWASYRILGDGGKELGRIIACAEKGAYGVIEMVMGVSPEGKVVALSIQRSRERVMPQLRSPDFLRQFQGKTVRDPLRMGQDLHGIPGGEEATAAVALGLRKMLILHSELK